MSLHVDVEGFKRDGYTVVRQVFNAEEIARIRFLITKVRDRARATGAFDPDLVCPNLMLIHGDLLGMPELREVDYVILHDRVLQCFRALLGDKLVYHGDSSAQAGSGQRGFHKDNADRAKPEGIDWKGEYGVARMAIYLQDHAEHSGGLKVRRRSHKHVSHHIGKAVNLDPRPGDIVFWYLTTAHSGNVIRVRGLPSLCLHPRLEAFVPSALRVPEETERMSIFCAFGAPGAHTDHYIDYQGRRPDVPLHWKRCGTGPEIDALARAKGVELRKPGEGFGTLAPAAKDMSFSVASDLAVPVQAGLRGEIHRTLDGATTRAESSRSNGHQSR